MLAIVPFDVPVPGLFKVKLLESCCNGQLSQPLVYGDINAIGRGIPNDKTGRSPILADRTQLLPYMRHVEEVQGDHCVVVFSAAVLVFFQIERMAGFTDIVIDGIERRVLQIRIGVLPFPRDHL